MTSYIVLFEVNGKAYHSKATVIKDYTTESDIPKILSVAHDFNEADIVILSLRKVA